MRSLIDILDLTVQEIDELITAANDIIANPGKYSDLCRGKKLAVLFYEPSTRTRLSFEAAMYELGGNVLGFSEAQSSSASKGESISDTVRTVSCYADIIAMRHPKEGAPLVASKKASIPVINAGDGGHLHPTQTLADLLTIQREKGRLDNITVGLCGDLKYGRTVHSLVEALSRYLNVKFVLISPEELKLPSYIKKEILKKNNIEYVQTTDLEAFIPELDILYMTRVQRERFSNEEDYLRLKDSYILTPQKLKYAKRDLCIMHPLPRVNEISTEIDDDPRACYFKQVLNGKYMRMALILKLLSSGSANTLYENESQTNNHLGIAEEAATEQIAAQRTLGELHCGNLSCITTTEQELPHRFKLTDEENKICRCIYCETKVAL